MKLVIAVIQQHKLDDVRKELDKNKVYLKTVSQVLGYGREKGETEIYRGMVESGNLIKKVRLEIAVNEEFVDSTVQAIVKGAQTGKVGDGKIFVVELHQCVRIRTGETGSMAIG